MKPFICFCWVIFATVWLSACGGRTAASSPRGGDTLDLRYAENLTLVDCGSYQMATLRNPWDTSQVLHTYLLVPRGDSLPVELPEGTVVRIPLERAVVFSSVHCALLEELGALDAIGGVCDLRYIRMPRIQERCRSGRIVDAGNGMNPDVEKIVSLRADALLLSPFENSGGYGRLGKLGVPLVECADYMETSPLGRAEWIRFYGRLFGRAAEADSVFAQVERSYRALASKVAGAGHRPKVLSDLKSGSAWYVPAGRSTTGRIYADAGGDYVFAGLEGSGSVPMRALERSRMTRRQVSMVSPVTKGSGAAEPSPQGPSSVMTLISQLSAVSMVPYATRNGCFKGAVNFSILTSVILMVPPRAGRRFSTSV